MKTYLFLLRDHESRWGQFSPTEQQNIIEKFTAWNASLREQGRFGGAGKLTESLGKTVRSRDEALVVDGPYCEAKEAIGGYYCVLADSIEEASEIAKGCPILSYGGSLEVREMAVVLAA